MFFLQLAVYIGLLEKELALARVQMAQLVLNQSGGKSDRKINEAALLRNLKQATAAANAAVREGGFQDYSRLGQPRRRVTGTGTPVPPTPTAFAGEITAMRPAMAQVTVPQFCPPLRLLMHITN